MGEEIIPGFKIDWTPDMRETALNNLEEVMASGMIASGKYVRECEEWIREHINVKHTLMVNSGSSALEAAAYVLKEKFGLGKVLIPANTFVSTSLSFERMGFEVDFYRNGIDKVDFEIPRGYLGIVVVDLGGRIPEDVDKLVTRAHEMNMWVCEDAAQAFGSYLGGKSAGRFGDIGIYSFFATKVFSSGEGGAIVTGDEELAEHVRMYRDFGKEEPWVSYHVKKGWNCRMNEFGAAVLRAQLTYFGHILEARAGIREKYLSALSSLDGVRFLRNPSISHRFNGYKTIMFLDPKLDMDRFVKRCEELGIKFQGSVYERILPEQPIYEEREPVVGTWDYDWKRMICLPSWYGMKLYHIQRVIETIKRALEEQMVENRLRGLGYLS